MNPRALDGFPFISHGNKMRWKLNRYIICSKNISN